MTFDSNTFSHCKLSAAPCNKIIILQALKDSDPDTADYLYRHITQSVNTERIRIGESAVTPHLEQIKSKQHLSDLLNEIERSCLTGTSPIIHLETHGCEGQGLVINPDGPSPEIVTWEELIAVFRSINIACNGNLTVILAACHSFEIETKSIKQQLASPFFALIGYERKVLPREIKLDLASLYDSLLLENSLPQENDSAMEKYRIYTEYSLVLNYLSVLLSHLSSPGSANGLIPTFEQFSAPPYPLAHLPLETQIMLFEDTLRSEQTFVKIIDTFMQNKENAELLKQDISRHFRTHFAD